MSQLLQVIVEPVGARTTRADAEGDGSMKTPKAICTGQEDWQAQTLLV
jgi:hypothetical protein